MGLGRTDEGGTAAVVLAAGAGSRFAGPGHKLTSALPGGGTLAARAVRTAIDAAIGPVAVVVGPVPAAELELPGQVTAVVNQRWPAGQATSLLAAVLWARSRGHRAIVVGLGDQPGLTAAAWRAVADTKVTPMAVATYDGHRAHPVRLAAEVWPDLPAEGDEGARSYLRSRPELVTEVACEGDPADIDTVDDLAAWMAADHGPPPGPR